MISKTKSCNIPMRFLLLKHGQSLNLSYCILMNFNHKHVKDITTIDKGKKIVEILWEKQQVSQQRTPKEGTNKANSSMLHIWDYWGIDMQQDC
jgi:hypothetical protein